MDSDFIPVELNLFKQATEQLKFDEFISHTNFASTKAIMDSPEVGKSRLDGFILGIGHSSIAELKASGYQYRDSDLTLEELSGICGKILEFQISRFDGYTIQANVQMSIYFDCIEEIQNPILKFMFQVFSHVQFLIEQLIIKNQSIRVTSWNLFSKYADYFTYYEKDFSLELENLQKSQTVPQDIVEVMKFEISLINYIKKPLTEKLYLPTVFPSADNEIGIDKYHRFNLVPGSPPNFLGIPKISEVPLLIKEMCDDVNSFQSFIRKDIPIIQLVENIVRWNTSGQHNLLTRTFATRQIVTNPVYDDYRGCELKHPGVSKPSEGEDDPLPKDGESTNFFDEEYFRNQLKVCHLNESYFSSKQFQKSILMFKEDVFCMVRVYLLPMSTSTNYVQTVVSKIWGRIQNICYEIYLQTNGSHYIPRVDSQQTTQTLKYAVPIWDTSIASFMLLLFAKSNIISGVYDDRDIHYIWHMMEVAGSTLANALKQQRTVDAVYSVVPVKTRSHSRVISSEQVNAKLLPPSAREVRASAIMDLFDGMQYMRAFFVRMKAFVNKKKMGMFYNEAKTYENISSISHNFLHFEMKKFDEYQKFINQFDAQSLKQMVKIYFDRAKSSLKELASMPKEFAEKDDSMMLKCIVMNSIFLSKFHENMKVFLNLSDNILFPVFQECQ